MKPEVGGGSYSTKLNISKLNISPVRLLVVSNRLPFTVVEEEGCLKFKESAGGLVSGLSAYLDSLNGPSLSAAKYVWVGWPGISIDDKMKQKKLKEKALSEFGAYPVFLSEMEMENFYHGFCNKTIWPLFHYFSSYAIYKEDYWACYKQVNETFCDAVMEILKPDDVVWIHDYHLMLLPMLLRKRMPGAQIGFFLHIPFPSYEIFMLLPRKWREEILKGILGADLVGFHTYDYTQHFLRCALRILGHEHTMGRIMTANRTIKIDTFPMGIDFNRFHSAAQESEEVRAEMDKLKGALSGFRVILSVDRLDYSKGIINRLQGFELFLEKNPSYQKKVVFLLAVVPSRLDVEHYEELKKQIDETVGKINGRFGTVGWAPIVYQYTFLPFHQLVALYAIADVALITSLRDGMNLVAKEYIATRTKGTGVLILSEMAGAARELGEAIIINPNDREEIAAALVEALEMPQEEQAGRNQSMQNRLKRYDVIRWAEDFIQALISVRDEQKRLEARLLSPRIKEQLIKDFHAANRRLLFLDYDGTLVPFAAQPQQARPSNEALEVLRKFSKYQDTDTVLISGRDRRTLENWFGGLGVGLVAEHGAWIKETAGEWNLIKPLMSDWKAYLLPILETFCLRLPGSFIEEKEFSIVWHYRMAEPELASMRAKELVDDLVNLTANIDVQVLQGNKVVEVRSAGINKGAAALHWISKGEFDFILAIGDDWTDEDLFKILPETAYSIKVGMTQSYARFNLNSHSEVIELLKKM